MKLDELGLHNTAFLNMIETDVATHNRNSLTSNELKRAHSLLNVLQDCVRCIDDIISLKADHARPSEPPPSRMSRFVITDVLKSIKIGPAPHELYSDPELASLMAKRNIYAIGISNLRFAIAPHRRLPPEILAKIFVATFDDTVVLRLPPGISTLPWALRSVCSTWRTVSLDDSALWRNLVLTLSESPDSLSRLPLLQGVVPRGPFSFTVAAFHGDLPGSSRIPILLNIKIPWDRLTALNIGETQWPLQTLSLLLKQCPSIQSLAFWSNIWVPHLRSPNLPHVPHLASLRVLDMPTFAHDVVPIPWSQLTDLTILQPRELGGLVYSLQQCTQLQTLCFYKERALFPIEPAQRIRLGALESLILYTPASWILSMLEVPKLCHLKLVRTARQPDDGQTFLRIHDMILRSACDLHSLRVSHHTSIWFHVSSYGILGPLIDILPNLTELVVPGIILPPEIVKAFIQGIILPKVQRLEVNTLLPDEFARMISLRVVQSTSALTVATAHVPAFLSQSVVEAEEVLGDLNEQFNTDFTIERDQEDLAGESPFTTIFRLNI
ncbi:hypothetical protein DXG01_013889 [Tephrocybe rancida]|nr:hypothetical protein DXG01_013889 [Tephrocybe rancida]